MILKIYNNKLSFIRMLYHSGVFVVFFFIPIFLLEIIVIKTDIFDPLFFNTEYNPGNQ